ncbi:MAG: hypothetical protein Q8N52_08245, partial [Acidobacteriota bacterium]|nr:hypothetical protein [Acidobacteriota bacterium]
ATQITNSQDLETTRLARFSRTNTPYRTRLARAATGRAIVCDPTHVPSDGVFILKTTDAM